MNDYGLRAPMRHVSTPISIKQSNNSPNASIEAEPKSTIKVKPPSLDSGSDIK